MGAKTEKLVCILREIILLLEADGETHWSQWMRTAKARLENSDYSGVEYLLNAYGGMGSFNDLIIGQRHQDGKSSWLPEREDKNDRLDQLRSQAWELAEYIKRNHAIDSGAEQQTE
jgi:hypothetical protein